MKPLVSAVIVNYNGKEVILQAINALKSQSLKNLEIIVVDNNSSDGSRSIIKKQKNVLLVENKKNLGYCGINSALRKCRGKYIFFTNNDISLGKDCIKNLADALESDDAIGISSPKVVNFFNKNLKSSGTWVSRSFYNGHFKSSGDSRKEIPYNGIAMIRKSLSDRFGYLFDGDYFTYAEDLDLGLRIRLLGYKVVHVPNAVLYHMHSLTLSKSKKYMLVYMMERNLLTTFAKILSIKNIIIFLPYVIAMRLAAIAKDLASLEFAAAGARAAAVFAVILNIPSILRKRRAIQKLRKKDDSFLLEVFSEKYIFSGRKINV